MKSLIIILFVACLALSPLASAGDVYCTPKASKEVCVDKSPICHSPTGYIFAYGGMTFAQDFDGTFPRWISTIRTRATLSAAAWGSTPACSMGADLKSKANLVKEIPVCGLTAFVGGGIGYAENEITYNNTALGFSTNTSDGALAWQFIAGVDVPVTACLDFFVQYKLLGIENTEYRYVDERVNIDSFVTHNLVFGGRISF